jgi:hypothetical protein
VPVPNKILKMLIATNCVFFSDFLTQHKSDPPSLDPNKNKRTNDNIEDYSHQMHSTTKFSTKSSL